jgi:hypothetical protein
LFIFGIPAAIHRTKANYSKLTAVPGSYSRAEFARSEANGYRSSDYL